jgi:hypothetical protein
VEVKLCVTTQDECSFRLVCGDKRRFRCVVGGQLRCHACGKTFSAYTPLTQHLSAAHGGVNSADAKLTQLAQLTAAGSGGAGKSKHGNVNFADLFTVAPKPAKKGFAVNVAKVVKVGSRVGAATKRWKGMGGSEARAIGQRKATRRVNLTHAAAPSPAAVGSAVRLGGAGKPCVCVCSLTRVCGEQVGSTAMMAAMGGVAAFNLTAFVRATRAARAIDRGAAAAAALKKPGAPSRPSPLFLPLLPRLLIRTNRVFSRGERL